MDIGTAFRNLIGAPHLLAARPNGPIVQVTARGQVLDLRSGRPYRYVGKLSDFCAIDWVVMTGQQLAELIKQSQPAAETK
jgi:hypothetical protein